MAKRDFRAVEQNQPRYPKPSELTQSSLGKLGLAALGGLLLGGTVGIPRAQAEETKNAPSAKSRGKSSQGASKGKPAKNAKDASTPTREPRFMPNGGKAVPRLVEVGDGAAAHTGDKAPKPEPGKPGGRKKDVATATKTSTDTLPPVERFPMRGEPANPRLYEVEKAPATGQSEGTAGKTDTKKQPESLPPPGAPPLPRKPEPEPPKKPK